MASKKLIIPSFIAGLQHYIYAHVDCESEQPFYIGVGTRQKKSQYARSKSVSGRNKFWKNTVNKHGYKIIIFAETSDYSEALKMEKHYIAILGLKNFGGSLVNATYGGEGCLGYRHSDTHKKYISAKFTGKNNPMYGTTQSDGLKRLKSERMSGVNNPRFGKFGGLNPRSKKIIQIDPITGDTLKTFESIRMAALILGISHSSINKALKKQTKCLNYFWNYGE